MKNSLFRAALGLLAVGTASAFPPDFERKEWVTGFNSPLSMKFAPDGRLFVLEQAGKLRVVKNGALLPTPFYAFATWAHRESMLGIAFDPKFAENGYVYVYYSTPKQKNRISRIATSKENPDLGVAASEVALLDDIGTAGYQGGAFFFGKDGMLYAGSAHGGSQDPMDLGGKALRIDPSKYPGSVIPADNPFVGKAGYRGEIYALGFREPFTGAADMVSGNMVFLDVGDGKSEEIDLLKPGANYGYEAGCEGTCAKAGMENPWMEYAHSVGGCITGGAFYRGGAFPEEYQGNLFFADWGASWIKRRDNAGKMVDFDNTSGKVIQLDVGPDGALYLLKINGENIPWTGSVQQVRYTKALSAFAAKGPRVAARGAGVVVGTGSGSGVRFTRGNEGVTGASLDVVDAGGRKRSLALPLRARD